MYPGLADCDGVSAEEIVWAYDKLIEPDWLAKWLADCTELGDGTGVELAFIVIVDVYISEELIDTLEEPETDGLGDCVVD